MWYEPYVCACCSVCMYSAGVYVRITPGSEHKEAGLHIRQECPSSVAVVGRRWNGSGKGVALLGKTGQGCVIRRAI